MPGARPLRADPAPARWFICALPGVAGWTDAVGSLLFVGLYVSFTSGDATQSGVTAGGAYWPGVAKLLSAQLVFVAGAALGRAVSVRVGDRHRPVLLGMVAAPLALAAVAGQCTAVVLAALLGTLAYRPLGAGALAVPALGCAILAVVAARTSRLRTCPPQQVQGESL